MRTPVRLRRGAWSGAVLLAALVPLTGCETSITDGDIRYIQTAEVVNLMERARAGEPTALLVLDPRPPERFARGHLPGARNMGLPPIEAGGRDPALTPYDRLVVAGDDPADPLAKGLAKRLMGLKYGGVRFYAGGLEEWKRLGHPIETGNPGAPKDP